MPVNETAGTPNITVPLHEVRSGSLAMPLSLSYHASGMRVTDQASWAGLGWALNAGGVITRQVRGLADERANGFVNLCTQVPSRNSFSREQMETQLIDAAANRLDYQPDLYTYNFQGQAGSFMLGNDGVFHTMPLQPVRISLRPDTTFLLTDAYGVDYLFAQRETSYSTGRPPASFHYTSAWYLSHVVSADKADTIRLEYETYPLVTSSVQQQRTLLVNYEGLLDDGPSGFFPGDSYSETISTTHQVACRLRRLVFRAGQVTFSTDARQDIRGEKRLATVTVVARGQDTLQEVHLYHSYFGGSPRLRLDSLAVTARHLRLPAYRFTYNSLDLPDCVYGPRDHWGYYNGAALATAGPTYHANLVPDIPLPYRFNQPIYPGADREPNPSYLQAGLLLDIALPTGGSQHFTYEPHSVTEQYEVPPIMLPTLAFGTTGPGPSETLVRGRHISAFDTLNVANPGTKLHYFVTGHEYVPAEQLPDDIHDKVTLFVYELGGVQQVVAQVEVQFSDPNAQGYGEVLGDIPLGIGSYRIELRSSGNTHAEVLLSPSYRAPGPPTAWRNALAGGVRLREQRIQASPQGPATIKRYQYNTPGTALSSGYLVSGSAPVYNWLHMARVAGRCFTTACPFRAVVDVTYMTISSNSLTTLTGGDRVVGYGYVTVVDSSSTGETSGYVVSRYAALPDDGGGWRPVLPSVSNAWQRDQLLEQRTYSGKGESQKNLLTVVKNDYIVRDTMTITSFNAGIDVDIQYDPNPGTYRKYMLENGFQPIGYQYLSRTRQYRYAVGDTAAHQLTTTTYHYDNPRHQQPTRVETLLANGQRQQVRSRYAADFDATMATSPTAQAVRELLRTHQVAKLLEQTTLRITGRDTLVTASALTVPRVLAPGIVVDAQQMRLRLPQPRPVQKFVPARLNGGTWTFDGAYEGVTFFDRYDDRAQLVQYHKAGGLPTSSQPERATGMGIAWAQATTSEQLACTSFEQGESGPWQAAGGNFVAGGYTGQTSYVLGGGSLTARWVPAGNYQLTCWVKQGGAVPTIDNQPLRALAPLTRGWQRYQGQVVVGSAGVVILRGDAQIDELRLHPLGAQVSTATYQPLLGMTSQTDAAGRTITYEYDALGRLLRTRDEQGRVLSQQQYHYVRH